MRRALHILAGLFALALLALFALDLRGRTGSGPLLRGHFAGHGELQAGAAKVELAVPYPVVTAGYGPRDRHEVSAAAQPQYARAIALQSGEAKLTLVSVDLLEIDSDLVAQAKAQLPPGFGELWVCATHTHTGMGNYDPNLLAQIAGTGRYRPEAREALLKAVVESAREAARMRAPSTLAFAQDELLQVSDRSSAADPPDPTKTLVGFATTNQRIELFNLAAHATLIPRNTPVLDGDWPAALTSRLERAQYATLVAVFQSAVGNVSFSGPGGIENVTHNWGDEAKAAAPEPASVLGVADLAVPLRAEIHTGPRWTRRAAANLVDRIASPREAALSVARVGPLTLIAVPGEPTADSGRILRKASGDPRALIFGLCNGYVGYVETPDRVSEGKGESPRQYFDARLLADMATATSLAVQDLPSQPPPPPPEPPPAPKPYLIIESPPAMREYARPSAR